MIKLNQLYLFLLAGALSISAISCSDKEDEPKPEPEPDPDPVTVYSIQLSMTDNGFDLGEGAKFTPGFNAGDKAGLFAVEDGKVVASNIELTFDGQSWKSAANIENSGDRYFVYAPYKADANTKVTENAKTASDFFSGLITAYAKPDLNQADFDQAVRPFDVKYAEAVESRSRADAEIIVKGLKLTAAADHALAITSWTLPGGTQYTTADGFKYKTPGSAIAGEIKQGSQTVTPYSLNGAPAFFHLPGADKISVAYSVGGNAESSDVALSTEAGKFASVQIGDGIADGGQRDLKIGDLYYRDGTVLPSETLAELTEAPQGVAGVIFCVDPDRFSKEETELLGKVHALVISAKMARYKSKTYFVWCDAYPKQGDDGAGRFIDNVEDKNFPGLVLPLIQDREDTNESYKINNNDISGYKYTQIIRKRRSAEIAEGYYPVFAAIDDLNKTVAVNTDLSTGWYLPSAGQMLDLMRNIGGAAAQADKVEKYPTSYELADFYFGDNGSPNLRANLDASMAKIRADEKDPYTDANDAIWTSSYATLYHASANQMVPGVREFVFNFDILFVMSYDVIGKGNARGVLAF